MPIPIVVKLLGVIVRPSQIFQMSILLGILSACNSGSFKSGSLKSGANKNANLGSDGLPKNAVHVPGDAESVVVPGGSPGTSPSTEPVIAQYKPGNGPLNLVFEPGNNVKADGRKVLLPLNLYVALDVTGSMEKNIQTLQDNIKVFSDRLKEKGFRVRLGLIPFRDNVDSTFDLTDDIEDFKAKVSLEKAAGGAGNWEASLMAVGHAVDRLQALSGPEDANVVLVISDNPGHFVASETDCRIDGLVAKLNGLPQEFQKRLRLYGSLDKGKLPCNQEYKDGQSQWDKVLETSLLGSELLSRGGRLSYPFEGTVILDEFVKSLVKTLPGSENICLATKATLKDAGTDLGSWPPKSIAEVYEKHTKSEKLLWNNVATEAVYKTLVGKTLDLEVARCCADTAKAAKGDFSGCVEQVNTARIEVK